MPGATFIVTLVFALLVLSWDASRGSETAPTSAPAASASITEFGAVGDGVTLNTSAIQAGIDHLSAAGGGTLVIPQGVFLSGAIFLKPGVNLHLDKGGVLKGSTKIEDYPKITTRIEGHFDTFLAALVNADTIDHLTIDGDGTFDGNGLTYWASFWQRRKENPNCTNLEVLRPRLLFIQNCQDFSIRGLTLKDSGFWNLHLYRCRDVTVDRLDVHVPVGVKGVKPPSTDGMDIDSCQRVSVTNSTFAVNDDCIALKGTKGPLALEDKQSLPVEHIRITGCTFNAGLAALTCGSEATEVHDVVLENCVVNGSMPLLHLKLRPDTPQNYHDITVRKVVMHNGTVIDVSPWKQFFDLKGQPAPHSTATQVTLQDITGSATSLGRILGNPGATITDFTLKDFDLQLKSDRFEHQPIDGLQLENLTINGKPYSEAPAP
jgi:alpha-L-rhamnosidase